MEQQRRFSIRANSLQPDAAFTLDGYVDDVHAVAAALAAAGVRVALVTLPPIGEDLGSSVNARVCRAARQGSTHLLVLYSINAQVVCAVSLLSQRRSIDILPGGLS